MPKIRRMFPGGNTSQGFISFHDNIIGENRNMLYILKGMPGGGKSSMMIEIANRALEEGYSLEYHHCPSDPDSVDGIVIEELKLAIVDGTAPHIIDPIYPGITDKIVDLAVFINKQYMIEEKEKIIKAKKANKSAYRKAFNYFKSAKIIHEEIENSNKFLVNKKEINKISKDLIEEVFSKEERQIEYNGFSERHLFSSAYTPEGYVDYTDTILEGLTHIYYIEGEIATGKSLLLNRILDRSRISNYSIEIYHDPMFSEKLESLYIKDLDTLVTSNKIAKDYSNHIINLNKYIYMENLNEEDYSFYKLLKDRGIESLSKAKDNHFILEKAYNPAIDYSGIDKLRTKLLKEILG